MAKNKCEGALGKKVRDRYGCSNVLSGYTCTVGCHSNS